jgi:TPR repeat protein
MDSQFSLAIMYSNGEGVDSDMDKAVYYYTEAAEQGHSDAQSTLGQMYYYGEDVEKDIKTAINWYEKAAAQDNADAQILLGMIYDEGSDNIAQDYQKAAEYYEYPANLGYFVAQNRLGNMYIEGKLGAPDPVTGCYWLYLSAVTGEYDASYCDENLTDAQKDEVMRRIEETDFPGGEYDG